MCYHPTNRYLGENLHHWQNKAETVVKAFNKIHGSTYHAFVRKYGIFQEKGVKYSWNDRIQNVMGEKLADGFNALDDDIDNMEKNNATNVKDLFMTLETTLNGKLILPTTRDGQLTSCNRMRRLPRGHRR